MPRNQHGAKTEIVTLDGLSEILGKVDVTIDDLRDAFKQIVAALKRA